MVLVLMGVTGTGKTTIGRLLSSRLGWPFEDGDDFHSEANKLKMASGTPLTDEDRTPWLQAIHARITDVVDAGTNEIVACSALKQSYRDLLRGGIPEHLLRFVLLTAPEALLAARLAARTHPFMNPNLLPSQIATLEWPRDAWQISVAGTPESAVEAIEGNLNALAIQP